MSRGLTHESSQTHPVEWYTPPRVFDLLRLEFDVDVCSPGADIVPWIPAKKCYTRADDGLDQTWEGRVWCNPPYGPLADVWLERMAAHGNGVALVLSRTDTKWFHNAAKSADALCFMRGRMSFIQNLNGVLSIPNNTVGAGSVFFAWGEENAVALRSSQLGLCFSGGAL